MDPFILSLQSSIDRFDRALRIGPLDAPVRGCPGWDLAELTRHLGFIHRWARLAAVMRDRPDTSQIDAAPDDPAALVGWFDAGAAALIEALTALEPDDRTWHPFTVAQVGRVWPRRQAHEAFVHAWDAEDAVGIASQVDPAVAADGIAEYFEVIVPRMFTHDARPAPVGTVAVVCTDADFGHGSDRLVVRVERIDEQAVLTIDPTATADTEFVGRALDLSLALWGRRPLADEPSHTLAQEWLRFGGN